MNEIDDVAEASTQSDPHAVRLNRRRSLKAAAAAAAAAGATWVAPRVEGLSVVPDFAAAGTALTGPIRFVIGSSGNEANVGSGGNPGSHWWAVSDNASYSAPGTDRGPTFAYNYANSANTLPVTLGGGQVTTRGTGDDNLIPLRAPYRGTPSPGGTAVTMSAPLGGPAPSPVGNVVVTVPPGDGSDLGAAQTFNVAFSVDPPFNRCRVANATLTTFDTESSTDSDPDDHVDSSARFLSGSTRQAAITAPNPIVTIVNPAGGVSPGGLNPPPGNWTSSVTVGPSPHWGMAVEFNVTCQ